MPFFSKVFRTKDAVGKKPAAPLTNGDAHKKVPWTDAWLRTRVDPEEVAELLRLCTVELKARALDVPFLLLPFRPSSDPSAARTFVRNFFLPRHTRDPLHGYELEKELRMTEVMVLVSVAKWCWARLPGGIVTWEAYEGFRVGEKGSNFARDAFTAFVPIGVDSPARVQIITDFFDLLAAVAAHGKANGLGGHKLSRYAGWWAFDHYDSGKGFESGYQSWENAATATCHMFFAYLRSLAPDAGESSGILALPRSLQQLVDATTYPPKGSYISNETTKVVMIVDHVSPTPYALLRRARNFEYRDDDRGLQQFATYEDPVQVLTDECRRVLKAISSTNQSHISNAKTSTSLTDPSWSRFEDVGFGGALDEDDEEEEGFFARKRITTSSQNTTAHGPYADLARPTTPSWADFLSSGFVDEHGNKAPSSILLPPDKVLPPISSTMVRDHTSHSQRRDLNSQPHLDPGELASITRVDVDDSFWWVWISSLAPEEPMSRKAVFGRCALIETAIPDGRWMVMEEQVKGAAPEPVAGAYIAEKKTFLGFTTKRGRLTRRRSGAKRSPMSPEPHLDANNRATLAPDQHAKIQQAAADLARKKEVEERERQAAVSRRGRTHDNDASKTNSIFTLGPLIKDEASPALQWANQYDKRAIRAKYLGDSLAAKGSRELLTLPSSGPGISRSTSTLSVVSKNKDLPAPPATKIARPPSAERRRSADTAPTSAPVPVVVEPVATTAASEAPMAPNATLDGAENVQHDVVDDVEKHQPAKLQKSVNGQARRTSPEQKKSKAKAPMGPPPVKSATGIRRLFGTKRSKSRDSRGPEKEETEAPASPTAPEDPAVAAARRALEGTPDPGDGPASPPLSPGHFERLVTVKPHEAARREAPEAVDRSEHPGPTELRHDDGALPTHMKEDEDNDQLSRVNTNERENADREFSTFDQGPLIEQPAFVPSEAVSQSEFRTPLEEIPQPSASVLSGPSAPRAESPVRKVDDVTLTHQVSPTDRWAQIRKNAAERAARQSEEQVTRSRTATRTDDGETSGEETIESRVARIKARVAELTGNLDAARP